ncbi:hypothetical protein PPROV_000438300 [Pycnococcus provasolii]|uniref:Uncharacterized protein n=1 Tax=Pycnococcus provasolii TaxID=41880 RepID=A0A830HGI0_9CHLO|nr:hypothetical protein PPROV_000438300 [Pycnococcus provasolii]
MPVRVVRRVVGVGVRGSEPPTGTTTTTSEASEKVRVAFRELYPPNSNQTVKYGVLKADVDVAAIPDESTQAKLREEAAKSLTNINADERERRKQIGTYVLAATAVAAIAMLVTHASPSTRATIALPLFFGSGFYLSGGGVWDVDGTGLQEIEDKSVADAILQKVNNFNVASAVATAVVVAAFCAIPL